MSVIGRLDEQVDAVLISPLSKQRQPEARDRTDAETPRQQSSQTPTASPAPDIESEAEREALPVWML